MTYFLRPPGMVLTGPAHRGEPAGALVLLHGRGTDEVDLLPLLDELDPGARLAGVSLRAPLQIAPGGYHWYSFLEVGRPDPPSFRTSYRDVAAWMDAELPGLTSVGPERTMLCGFSQGAVMAYALALGRGRPAYAGLIALSGFIPEVPGVLDLDLAGHRRLPVAIGHGALDPVIGVRFGRAAAQRLQAAGLQASYHESPALAHGIDRGFTAELAVWLQRLVTEQLQAA